jgi:hypothetical protein
MRAILIKLWQWIFPGQVALNLTQLTSGARDAYDPFQDDERILKGEIENYFE